MYPRFCSPFFSTYELQWLRFCPQACFTPGGRRGSQGHRAGKTWTGPNRWRVSCKRSRSRSRATVQPQLAVSPTAPLAASTMTPGVDDDTAWSTANSGEPENSSRLAQDLLAATNAQDHLPANYPIRTETAAHIKQCMLDEPAQPGGCSRWCCRLTELGLVQSSPTYNRSWELPR